MTVMGKQDGLIFRRKSPCDSHHQEQDFRSSSLYHVTLSVSEGSLALKSEILRRSAAQNDKRKS